MEEKVAVRLYGIDDAVEIPEPFEHRLELGDPPLDCGDVLAGRTCHAFVGLEVVQVG
jgi:hypothetical protein